MPEKESVRARSGQDGSDSMKHLRIALDIDGVIVDYAAVMLPVLSRVCQRPVAYEDICHWDVSRALDIDPQVMDGVWDTLLNGDSLLDAPPVEGAIDGLASLRGHEVWLVTGRPASMQPNTLAWLSRYGARYDNIVFGRQGDKQEIVRGFDLFVEDFAEEACSVAETGVLTLLYDRPWNRTEVLPDGCRRVHGWDDIIAEMRRLEQIA